MLDLVLSNGDFTVEQVSWTFSPFCVRPFEVDVVASAPDAGLENLTGVLINGCGGDTSYFDIRFTGDGRARSFDLQFVDAEFGGVLGTIPTTVSIADPADLNRDGFVDGLDLGILLGNFDQNGIPALGGELNGTDPVDGLDLGILLGAWDPPLRSPAATIPEPSTIVVLAGLAAIGLFTPRKCTGHTRRRVVASSLIVRVVGRIDVGMPP